MKHFKIFITVEDVNKKAKTFKTMVRESGVSEEDCIAKVKTGWGCDSIITIDAVLRG